MYWARGSILRRLRALHLIAADFEPESGQEDGTTAHALERVIGLLAREAGMRVLERSRVLATPQGPAPL
jgi:lipopolysaccharide biosynthesis protein